MRSRGEVGTWIRRALLGLAIGAAAADSQSTSPVLLLQPGMTTADFVSVRGDDPATTGFTLRVVAIVPSASRWWTLLVGASATPYGSSGASLRRDINAPALFAGNVFPLVSHEHTGGWLSADLPVLVTYSRGGGSDNNPREFGRDLALDLALTAHVGQKLLGGFGAPLARLRAYAILEQNLTPNRGPDDRRDRFNPVAYYGITIPFGTSRLSP